MGSVLQRPGYVDFCSNFFKPFEDFDHDDHSDSKSRCRNASCPEDCIEVPQFWKQTSIHLGNGSIAMIGAIDPQLPTMAWAQFSDTFGALQDFIVFGANRSGKPELLKVMLTS